MPIVYRNHVKPPFNRWIGEGFTRWQHHEALQACLKLTEKLLHYPEPAQAGAGWMLIERGHVARLMKEMRAFNVTPGQIFCRVAEFYAFFERHPERARPQRVEDFALARGVLHMLPWTIHGKRVGARTLSCLGQLIREHLYAVCCAFVKRLHDDDAEQGALMKQAVRFT